MFILIFIFAIFPIILYCISLLRHMTFNQLLREAGYQIYYYVLGGKGMLEDYTFSNSNKTELISRPGEVAVVTGGARGIGVEVVKKLVQCDMHVVIGCRTVEAGEKVIKEIRNCGIESGEMSCFPLDLASFESIKTFAHLVLTQFDRIDLLVNNAGIMFVPFALTDDGIETHFAVNYLGHCLLSHLLLPCMIATAKQKKISCRIVNVSSCAHLAGSMNFEDLTLGSEYIPSASYAQSKLAQVIFTKSLDSKLKDKDLPVQVHAIHPGIVNTDLFDGTLLKKVAPWVPGLFFKTPDKGSITIVHACLSPMLEGRGGSYISNCREAPVSTSANSKKVQARLWKIMLELIHVEKFGGLLE